MPEPDRPGYPYETLVEALQFRAAEGGGGGFTYLPDDDAPEVRLSFVKLDRRARAVAALLQEQGRTGQRALLCYPPGVDFLIGLFGCFYAGTIAVPLYPPRARRVDARLESAAADCDAAVLLTSADVHQNAERLTASMPRLRALAWLDTTSISDDAADGWREPRTQRNDLAALQYTSGSTGTPKGVMLTHGCLLHNLARMREVLGLSADTPGVSWLPAFHDMGLIGNFLQAVFTGLSLTILSPAAFAHDPLLWLRTIGKRHGYVSGGPCFAFQHCVNRLTPEAGQGLDLDGWRVAYIGAEPIIPAVLDRFATAFAPYGFRREAFFPCYGLAEATLMVTGTDRTCGPVVRGFRAAALEENRAEPDEAGRPLVGCGQALAELELAIIDPANGALLPEGRVGEIWVAGPSVAAGYWQQPEETARVFQARRADRPEVPYLRSGDLGFLQAGELFVSGRSKDLLIIRGRNYHPQDLEAAAAQACPELPAQLGAAIALDAEDGPRIAIVHEVRRDYQTGSGPELFARIRQAVADQFELEVHALALVKAGSIPKSSSGKIRRQECLRRYQARELALVEVLTIPPEQAHGWQPVGSVRAWLIDRLAQRLNISASQIDVDRPFATYGFDSLALVTMAADLQQWLGRRLSPTLLYRAPTIAALAAELAGTAVSPVAHAPPGSAPVAVIGIGCRFPQADGPEQFWQLLCEGRCVVGTARPGPEPAKPQAAAAYLADVQHFDAAFFGIAPVEAACIDPQHRILLEVAWHALEHADLAAQRLAGGAVGVFVGIASNDYGRLLLAQAGYTGPYLGTGNSSSMAAHRLSYHLDLRGPSLAVDTACSSSLVAVHLACQSLRNGECELALAGGVNLMLAPELTEVLSQAGMLSPSGRCRTFDAAADGYVRGEGCGVVVLKPLPAALRDGDRILAILEASAVNQDGRSNGITAPNGAAQADLIRRVLRQAERSPAEVGYIEAHGTGTPLGDPIEFEALTEALEAAAWPCALASVKTNLGHLEAAAGIAGLIKTVLQVHHGRIAPHLHLEELNPRIQLEGSRFHVPQAVENWPEPNRPRLAGVSSFGFGGTNAHVLVGQAPPGGDWAPSPTGADRPFHLLPLSAQSEPALRELASRYRDWLESNPAVPLADVCAAASRGRNHFRHRLAVRGTNNREVFAALAQANSNIASHDFAGRVAFLFTGQGSQYANMARPLYQICPAFREALDRCGRILAQHGFLLHEALADAERLERTDAAQPALFAVEYALAETWRHWGVEPAAVLGHSLGEYVAACLAGVFSLEDGLKLAAERGRLMQACPPGVMLACLAPLDRVREHLDRWGDDLAVAAINGSENIIVSGPPGTTAALREELAAHGIESRWLRVRQAFHSPLIEPALSGLLATANTVAHRAPAIPLISNRTGEFFTDSPTPDYWVEHARFTVHFAAGIRTLHQAGITHFLEIGPDPVLCRLGATIGLPLPRYSGGEGRGEGDIAFATVAPSPPTPLPRSTGGEGRSATWLASLRRGADDWSTMLDSLGRLYTAGASIDWDRFDEQARRRRLSLPSYPFQRQRYWLDDVPRLHRSSTGLDRLPGGLQGTLAPIGLDVLARHDVDLFAAVRSEFDRLAGAYLIDTFRRLGWSPKAGERIEDNMLAERLGIIEPYRRLLGRLLTMAGEDGWLTRIETGWQVVQLPRPTDTQVQYETLLARFPAFAADLRLAHRCAGSMAAVLHGEEDPLQVLFADEGAQLTEHLYEQSPIARLYNELASRSLAELVTRLTERSPVRILEVGAGTGGTTAHVLPLLPAEGVEFLFTDVSRLFLAQGREKFARFPFVKYRLLDLEQEPAVQGFEEGQFDIVLAANVFHATGDLRRCVKTARRMLAPGGVLILLEGTGPRRLLDFIFGLTPGWWKFNDSAARPDYPLATPNRWLQLLSEEDFVETAILPPASERMPEPDQVVIVARAGVTEPPRTTGRTGLPAHLPESIAVETPVAEVFDRAMLLAAPVEERRAIVESLLRREFASVLGLELSAADLDRPLQAFGLDSLIAIQFRNRIEARLGVSLSIVELLKGTSLGRIIDNSLAQLAAGAEAERAAPGPEISAEQVEQLSEKQLENALQSLLR